MIKPNFTRILWLALLLVAGCAGQSYDSTTLPLDSAVKVGKLENGLTYYIRRNTKPEKKAELRLVVNSGSIQEEDDQRGLAHFTEHMAFNGTRDFKKNELISYLQSIGMEFGPDLNAYTSYEETVYMLSIPLQNQEHLETGFKILENWAGYISFEDEEIDKERGVVLEELREGKGADDRMWEKMKPELFMNSKYADRDPIGDETLLKTFPYEAIKRYYQKWYRPDLMAVIAVGDFETAEIEKMIHRHFSSLPKPEHSESFEVPTIDKRTIKKAMVVTDKEATSSEIFVVYPIQKDLELKNIGDYKSYTIQWLAMEMINLRLFELSNSENPPFSSADIGDMPLSRHRVLPYFSASVGEAGVEAALTSNIREAQRVYRYGFTVAELSNAKKNVSKLIENWLLEKDKSESKNFVEEYLQLYLAGEPSPGAVNEHAYISRYLSGITLNDVNQFIKNHVAEPDHYLAVYTGPEKSSFPMPTEAELHAFIGGVAQEKLEPYSTKILPEGLLAAKPTPGSIVARKDIATPELTELTLSNGIKVILKPTLFKNDEIILEGFRKGGQFLYPDSDYYSARYASSLVSKMGLSNFTPTDITNILSGKQAEISASLGNFNESFYGSSGRNEIEEMFQLLHLHVTDPRKDEELFKSFIAGEKVAADKRLESPENYFHNKKLKTLYNHHPRTPSLYITRPELDMINLDRAFEIYQQRFGDASDFTFVIAGAFDIESILPLVETYVASLPVSGVTQHFSDPGLRPVQGVVKKEFYKGREQKSEISIMYTGKATYSRSEKLKLNLLTDIINIKIMETLRENLGLIYSGGADGFIRKVPYERYFVAVSLPCGPDNVNNAIDAFWQEVKLIQQQGPNPDDLHKVQETMIQKYFTAMKDNSSWVQWLVAAYTDGEDPAILTSGKEQILSVTPTDIQEAARVYFNDKNYVQTVLYPEQ